MTITSYKYYLTVASVCIATLLVNIEMTAVTLIITPITNQLNIPLSSAQWILSSYLLAFSAFVIVGGKLGDVLGNKKIILYSILLFVIASLIGAISNSFFSLITARILQGMSAAMVIPNATALIYLVSPDDKKGFALGLITSVVGLGASLGPFLGGALTALLGWRSVFYLNVPLGLLSYLLIFYVVPVNKKTKSETIDYIGMVLLIAFMGLFVYTLTNFIKTSFYITASQLLIAIIFGYAFYKHCKSSSNPLLNFSLLSDNTFLVSCIVRSVISFFYYNVLFLMGIYLQSIYHYTPLKSGIMYLPMTLIAAVTGIYMGRVSDKYGVRKLILLGLFLLIISSLLLSIKATSPFLFIITLVSIGAGYGTLYPSTIRYALSSINNLLTGQATGIFYIANLTGGIIGVAYTGMIMMLFRHRSTFETINGSMQICFLTCLLLLFITFVIFFLHKKYVVKFKNNGNIINTKNDSHL